MLPNYSKRLLLTLSAVLFVALYALGERQLTSKIITTRDGLPSNQVYDMAQDEKGYIWMGTANGLCRFDGYTFVQFQEIGSSKSKASGAVGTILMDRKNHLMWLRTPTFAYSCYDLQKALFLDYFTGCDPDKTFQKYLTDDEGIWMYEAYAIRRVSYKEGDFHCRDYPKEAICTGGSKIIRLLSDKKGGAWVLTDHGLLHIHPDDTIERVVESGNMMMGNQWNNEFFFLTDNHKILIFNQEGKKTGEVFIPPYLGAVEKVNGNIIWQNQWVIMERTNVFTMDCANTSFQKPRELQMDYGIPLDNNDGNHWISDKDGLLHLFPTQGSAKVFRLLKDTGYSFTKKRRFSVAQAADKLFYIATFGNGLFVYDAATEQLSHYTAQDKHPLLTSNYLTDILADRDGNVWISQEDAGVVCISEKQFPNTRHIHIEPDQQGEMSNYVKKMAKKGNGDILIGTRSQGLYIFHPQTGIVKKEGSDPYDDTLIDSITDKRGRIWLSKWEEGLLVKQPGADEQLHFLTKNISESRINALGIDPTGRIWAATYNGLYMVDSQIEEITDQMFKHYGIQEGLPANNITCLLVDNDGSVWLGGEGTGVIKCLIDSMGIFTSTRVTKGNSLGSNNVHSLVSDAYHHIWASTDDALICIDSHTMDAIYYNTGTSLLSNLYSDRCALPLDNGDLLFGTHDGIKIIHPTIDNPDVRDTNRTILTGMDINGLSIFNEEQFESVRNLQRSITLTHHQNTLTFYFSNFDYAYVGQTMYQFYLEGTDKGWREPTTQHNVDYGNLPPGNYIFHLRTSEDGEETTLDITIRQPWYNTWWAWLIYLIVFGTAAWYVYRNWQERFRLHQQMKIEKEVAEFRANFFTQVAHEFRTPLAIISGAVDKIGEESGTQKKTMQTAKRGVRRLTQLVNQLMEFRKINTGNLRLQVEQGEIIGFIRDIYQDFWNAAQQKDLSISFTAFDKKYTMPFDRHFIDTITYNLLSNAIKYTPQGGTITLRLKLEEVLKMIVEDSGPGIDESRKAQLFQPFMHGYASQGGMGIGLYTAYKMAQAHKGSLTYEQSETLGGSQFTLTIPADGSCYEVDEYRTVTAIEKTKETQRHADNVILEMLPNALNDLEIAIIEDDPDMLEQIKAKVGVYFKVKGYTSGEVGFEAMKQAMPSLLICDVMLPDTNGYDIVKKMKADEELRNVPVIMLTALDDEQHQIKGYEAGADDYMVKPCNYKILIARSIQLIKWNETHRHHEPVKQEKETTISSEPTIITSQADKRFLEKVNAIVIQHISDPDFSIDQMAELMRMGRTKLYGKVKEMTGMSPNKLFIERRMKMAAELLEEGELNISEIGYKVGIPDPSYFNKCFKQYFGVTPSKFHKE